MALLFFKISGLTPTLMYSVDEYLFSLAPLVLKYFTFLLRQVAYHSFDHKYTGKKIQILSIKL